MTVGRSIDPFSNSYVEQSINTSSYGASSNWIIFNGFTIRNQIEQDLLNVKASENDVAQYKFMMRLDIILAYMRVLVGKELAKVSYEQKMELARQRDRLILLVGEGLEPKTTIADIEAQIASADFGYVTAVADINSALQELEQLINWHEKEALQIEDMSMPEIPFISKPVMLNTPAMQSAQYKKEAAQFEVHLARGSKLPSASLNFGFATSYSSVAPAEFTYSKQLNYNLGQFIRLNINLPIFSNGQFSSSIRMAQLNLKIQENEYQKIKNVSNQQLQKAYLDYTNALEKQKSASAQLIANEKVFDSARGRFDERLLHFVEFNTFNLNLQKAKSNLIMSSYEVFFKAKVLQAYEDLEQN
jgi:outer membrane protein